MGRLLLFAAIAAVAWYLFRRLRNPPTQANPPMKTDQAPITQCAQCGIHAPESSGVHYQNLFFCSPDHLTDYVRKHGPQ